MLAIATDGSRILHTLLVKHCNDLLDRQNYERGKDEVHILTYMSGTFFVYTLGLSMPIHCSALLIGCVKFCSRLYLSYIFN